MLHKDLRLSKTKWIMLLEDTSPKNVAQSTIHLISTMMSNRRWEENRECEAKRWKNKVKIIAQYNETRGRVKIIVQQEKRNKELSSARICKHNPKIFSLWINERRIVWDNIGPLKTRGVRVVITDNDTTNTLNNYFSSVFTYVQLNNIPQLDQYYGNTIDTF